MKKNNNAFTLVEIIISTIILSIWVFWVYKLLSTNLANLSNFENIKQSKNLIINTKECIKSLWFNTFYSSSQTNYNFSFWNDNKWCLIDSSAVKLDNKDYFISGEITSKDTNKITWILSSKTDSINTQTWTFTLYK